MKHTVQHILLFSFISVSLYAKPIINSGPNNLIYEQDVSLSRMEKIINNHLIIVELANKENGSFDIISIDGVEVIKRHTDMIPSGLLVSDFRCEFYLIPTGKLPSDLNLVVGLTFNNNIWYMQYAFIDLSKTDSLFLHIFMMPERDNKWDYIFKNREIYYFIERQS